MMTEPTWLVLSEDLSLNAARALSLCATSQSASGAQADKISAWDAEVYSDVGVIPAVHNPALQQSPDF
jgi:hypothetical protein